MTGHFCPSDCSGCQCPNGHPPCSHCVEGHDDTIDDRMDNMHIDWSNFNPGDYATIDGVDLIFMTRSDYVIEREFTSKAPWRQGGSKIAVHAEGVSGLALANIRERHGWLNTSKLKVTVSDKRPTISGATADMIIVDDVLDSTPIIYNLDKNRSLDAKCKPGDTVQFQSLIWRVVDCFWLTQHDSHVSDSRLCCHENRTFLVRPDDYDRAMLIDAVSTIAKAPHNDPDGPPTTRRVSGVHNAPAKRRNVSNVQPHHSTALSLALSRSERPHLLHSELRSGTNPYTDL